MKQTLIALSLILVCAAGGWGSSFFEIELANNVSQDTEFNITGNIDDGDIALGSGKSLGLYIGSEMALDFNLKLDVELGFHSGKYLLDSYSVGGAAQNTSSALSYFNYVVMMGVRLKYDWQITDSLSIEPYVLAGLTPMYMYSPSSTLESKLTTDVDADGSFNFVQSNIWALDYFGFGVDFDLTRSSVEYSGSSKYLFGISIRRFHRSVSFEDDVTDTKVSLICLTGTVLF